MMDSVGKLGWAAQSARSLREAQEPQGPQFSILVRTIGNRNELLRETLLSVFAQTIQDSEVLVLFHAPSSQSPPIKGVQDVIDALPKSFRDRARVIVVTRPGRSAPLNDGIAQAKGRLLCILDDDDLYFEHHLESIARAIKAHPQAAIVQTFASKRTIGVVGGSSQDTFPYTVTKIATAYTEPFNAARQLRENFVPSCNFCFSRPFTVALNIGFDESLEVLEDWKFLMDLNRYSEVAVAREITTAIGMRDNATNTVGNPQLEQLWAATRKYIQAQFASEPRMLGETEMRDVAQSVKELIEAEDKVLRLTRERRILKRIAWKIIRFFQKWTRTIWRYVPRPFLRARSLLQGLGE